MKLSIGGKIAVLIMIFAVLLSGTSLYACGKVIQNMIDEEYTNDANAMASTVAVTIDGDKMQEITDKVLEKYNASEMKLNNEQWDNPDFETYVEQYLYLMEDESYLAVREELRKIQDVNDVDCIYTLKILPENFSDEAVAIYVVDGAYDDIVTPGCFDMVEESCYPYLQDLEQGFPAFITNTPEYGWVVTACAPIHNSKGEIVCFSAVDISMNEVMAKKHHFLFMLAGVLFALTTILCVGTHFYISIKIVRPINMLSDAAGQYSTNQFQTEHHEFGSIRINTGDELEVLLESMIQMEKDIDSYIDTLTQTRVQLSSARQQADDLHELAHMDALTGIRNKLAYDKEIAVLEMEIQNGVQKIGIAMIDLNFLKVINDNYGHEQGNIAIMKLSKLICNIFKHSPVFRIGGDEFAIVLKNHDYDHIETLVQEFNAQLEKLSADETLPVWERLSAAFGYALFNSELDHNAEDIFKRADHAMYERKKEMKALRK